MKEARSTGYAQYDSVYMKCAKMHIYRDRK